MSHEPTRWRKSTFSTAQHDCVELAEHGDTILLRDSKHPEHGAITFNRTQIATLIASAKAGHLDDLVT